MACRGSAVRIRLAPFPKPFRRKGSRGHQRVAPGSFAFALRLGCPNKDEVSDWEVSLHARSHPGLDNPSG